MKIIPPFVILALAGCVSNNTSAPPVQPQNVKEPYSVEKDVLIELKIKTINNEAMEGHFLRAIALRGHDMSDMTSPSHDHNIAQKDQPVNLLNELAKYGCVFKTELDSTHQRLTIKNGSAFFSCAEHNYFVEGELIDTHGKPGGAMSLTKGSHIYFKIK